ncbi:glycine--tRNA ligase subunit beta [Candidatus Pelagibacter sp.]|nr:glycine--tRNA ligase subunit beta [Candidatus Pelagibacter sp.]
MSEFFLELFSEEIPPKLQINTRKKLFLDFNNFFEENNIIIKGSSNTFSTPNRIIINFSNISKEILKKPQEIRGPSINAKPEAIEGFIKFQNIKKSQLNLKSTEKGEFYFYKKPAQKLKTQDLLKKNIPLILDKVNWNKSMKWGNNQLFWGRPLKSILAIFDGRKIDFEFYHLKASNFTFIDKDFEEKTKYFNNFKSYQAFFKSIKIILDQDKREDFIVNELNKISKRNNLIIELKENLLSEINNIVEKPKIILCEFNKKFLNIPQEILIITMQNHQKYIPTFDNKKKLTNFFLVVLDSKDPKGYIKQGNERVIEARLNDAEFFWNRNKSQNLIKQLSDLKNINFFKGLGSYFDKTQRIKKLSSLISDELMISKEKVEIAASICKVDLKSDLVGEFPELQGIMGGYFAEAQGFDKEVCQSVSEHYLPSGIDSKVPKNLYSITLSLSDKIDTLVGFFGLDLIPTGSRDPYALRRNTIALVRLIVENKIKINLRSIINYSLTLYKEQGIEFDITKVLKELNNFILDRLKNYSKEKNIRLDIIESSLLTNDIDNLFNAFKQAEVLNRYIKKEVGQDIVEIYKRSLNILNNEIFKNKLELSNSVDTGLFKNDFEKSLYKKIQDIKKYYINEGKNNNFEECLLELFKFKQDVNSFFDNVKVNDENEFIKKNRLELLNLLCKSFDNFFNFSKIEG